MTLEELEIPLTELKGIGARTALKLSKNKIKTLKDLLYFFPFKYIDLTQIKKIKDLKINEFAVIVGKISNLKLFPSPRKRIFLIQGIISDETGSLKVIWYNQPFLMKKLKNNSLILVYGKLTKTKFGLHLQSPKFEVLTSLENIPKKIIPVYSEISGLKSNFLAKVIESVLNKYNLEDLEDPLPLSLRQKNNYPSLGEAIKNLHQPKKIEDVNLAKERLAFEELLYIELALLQERQNLHQIKAPIFKKNEELINKFLSQFSFHLTSGQKKVLEEIFADLKKGAPMNRLLQGETGAGKTLIAEIAALTVVHFDWQVVFMAPTEILAQQHFERFKKDFANFDFGIALITSGQIYYAEKGLRASKNLNFINQYFKLGKIKILIGTHSLIENDLTFDRVGLVIIDEQQRFGTEQRKRLLENTKQKLMPHFLSMSATPIPRTLALALYGDLDFSFLEDKPFDCKEIKTYLVPPNNQQPMWRFINKEINESHQTFIICPRVEEKEDEIASVKKEFERVKKIFPQAKVEMLHGKMKSQDKEKILKKMQNNEINILVSSSVVEVGIDLPLATVIVILSPERFGLAQLYQLRGRVGRSVHQGYCFLVPQKLSLKSKLRLKYFLQAKSAFQVAEYDLKLRGSGEFLGERQSGIPDLAMESLKNLKLVEKARKIAQDLILKSPNFSYYQSLLKEVNKRKGIILG